MPQDEAGADQARREVLDRLGRDRRRRRGQGRAARGRRLPARSRALREARRARAEGRPAARPARHRQDAARQGRRARVRRAVLLAVGGVVRRDVRRPRRRAHPAPVPRGAQARAGDHLHRRARRRRRAPRLGHLGRARADAQPAARRDGRLQLERRPRRHGRVEPAREARPGAAAARPLRPPGVRLAAGRRRAASASSRSTRATSRSHDVDLAQGRRADERADRRRPREPLQRGGDPLRAPRRRRARRRRTSTQALERVIAGVQSRRVLNAHEKERRRLPRGRPRAVRASCCRASTACTRSRSSRAGGRSATRSTCPTRIATSRRARSSSTT